MGWRGLVSQEGSQTLPSHVLGVYSTCRVEVVYISSDSLAAMPLKSDTQPRAARRNVNADDYI